MPGTIAASTAVGSPKLSGAGAAVGASKTRPADASPRTGSRSRTIAGTVETARGARGAVRPPETLLAFGRQQLREPFAVGAARRGVVGSRGRHSGASSVGEVQNESTDGTKKEDGEEQEEGDGRVSQGFFFSVVGPHFCL